MRVLVTGGCGFIGSHMVERHLSRGDTVHVVDDLTTGSLKNIINFENNPNFLFDKADIIAWHDLTNAVAAADRIYHFAAVVGTYRVLSEPIRVISTNIAGTERLLRAINATGGKQRLLIASSAAVYGPTEHAESSETDLLLSNTTSLNASYATSKITDEALGLAYYHAAKIPITIARLFNVIGPRQSGRFGMVTPRFIRQACNNEPITVYGNGMQTRCFMDVRDVVAALDLLMNTPHGVGQIVNVGNNNEINMNELAALIKRRANSDAEIIHIPYEEAYHQEFNDLPHLKPNLNKLYQLTHFRSKWMLENTIDALIDEFMSIKTAPINHALRSEA